MDGVHLKVKI